MTVSVLETQCEWTREDVADPTQWTEVLSDAEVAEIDAAIAQRARAVERLSRHRERRTSRCRRWRLASNASSTS